MNRWVGIVCCGIVASVVSPDALAIDCGPARVIHIQIENNGVLVFLEGQSWHLVGLYSQPGTKEKYAALLAAQMADKQVVVRYPDGLDCAAQDFGTPSQMVRTLD